MLEGDCIEWQGYRDPCGYGRVSVGGRKAQLAHRIAWERAHGPIPDGMCVLHRCDNPPCCNPAHLFLGTQADNVADAKAKGRIASGDRNGSRTRPDRRSRGEKHSLIMRKQAVRGERHYAAKLTDAQVRSVLARLAAGETQVSVAHSFGVSRPLISMIASGHRRKEVA